MDDDLAMMCPAPTPIVIPVAAVCAVSEWGPGVSARTSIRGQGRGRNRGSRGVTDVHPEGTSAQAAEKDHGHHEEPMSNKESFQRHGQQHPDKWHAPMIAKAVEQRIMHNVVAV